MDDKPETPTPKRASWFQIEHLHHWRDDGHPVHQGFRSRSVTAPLQTGEVTLWTLFLISLASWPLLYMPLGFLQDTGLGGVAFMMFIWCPSIVLMNIVILLVVMTVIANCRPRQVSGRIAAALAAIHPIIFMARIIAALCLR
jgi:hypothetical protein